MSVDDNAQKQREFLDSLVRRADASIRLRRTLGREFATFGDVWGAHEDELVGINNFGMTTLRELRAMFTSRGFKFKSDDGRRWDPDRIATPKPAPTPMFLEVDGRRFLRVNAIDEVLDNDVQMIVWRMGDVSSGGCRVPDDLRPAWRTALGLTGPKEPQK